MKNNILTKLLRLVATDLYEQVKLHRSIIPWIVAFVLFIILFKVYIEESGNLMLISATVEILFYIFLAFIILVLPFIIYIFLIRLQFLQERRWHKPFVMIGVAAIPMAILLFLFPMTRNALFTHRIYIASGILLFIFLFLSYVSFAITHELLYSQKPLNRQSEQLGVIKSLTENKLLEHQVENNEKLKNRVIQNKEMIFILSAIATIIGVLYSVFKDILMSEIL